jgi:uncharacterized protein (DUF4213/DUF364 family)
MAEKGIVMGLNDEFNKMVLELTTRFTIPPIEDIFLPPFRKGGQPKDAQFMALSLEGGAAGVSFVLLPDDKMSAYTGLKPPDFIGKNPREFALAFGSDDPVKEMIGLAAINAICQHAMRETDFEIDEATDSMGLLSIAAGDRIGMVGFFFGLIKTIKQANADLIIVEKNEKYLEKYPDLHVTLDPSELNNCNKVLCTSTTILNNSLDEIISYCAPQAFVSIIGPTAGYFPDPLFARGVDVVGGRVVKDGRSFLRQLAEKRKWGAITRRTCFQKKTYASMLTSG